MPGKIEVLSSETINQIAAGEVIDRPSSVVKELVENAIDAKASAITVEIKEGGLSFIRITDNGSGINKEDVKVAFLRHATSKIKSVIDLLSISSLGFRGEALSSIAAVSQVELITKPKEQLTATRYIIEGGKEISLTEIGAPGGTTFFVRNLFYNTPARRKFLKSAVTEGNYITELMYSLALSHPDISFEYIQNGQNKLYTTGTGNLRETCYSIFGRNETASFLELPQTTEDAITLTGFICEPSHSRGNRKDEYYFINGRYIKSRLIAKAIEDGYQGFLMQHRYPASVLSLELPSDMIDVNVHPSKMEIRFKDEPKVYSLINKAIKAKLNHVELIPSVTFGKDDNVEVKKQEIPLKKPVTVRENPPVYNTKAPEMPKSLSRLLNPEIKEAQPVVTPPPVVSSKPNVLEVTSKKEPAPVNINVIPEVKKEEIKREEVIPPLKAEVTKNEEQLTLFDDKLLTKEARSKHRLIGQLFDTYWLIQYEDKFFIMDQHAAHEKVLYEKNVKCFQNKEFSSQLVSPPIVLNLRPQKYTILKENMDLLTSIGYEFEEFGIDTYLIRGVPANLYDLNQQEILEELLSSLEDHYSYADKEDNKKKLSLATITDKLATISCKAAVKGNMTLSYKEANALIEQLLTLENPYNCPHGRPTIISMTKYEIERKFARKI